MRTLPYITPHQIQLLTILLILKIYIIQPLQLNNQNNASEIVEKIFFMKLNTKLMALIYIFILHLTIILFTCLLSGAGSISLQA